MKAADVLARLSLSVERRKAGGEELAGNDGVRNGQGGAELYGVGRKGQCVRGGGGCGGGMGGGRGRGRCRKPGRRGEGAGVRWRSGDVRPPLYRMAPDAFLKELHVVELTEDSGKWRRRRKDTAGGKWEWCGGDDGGQWYSWASVRQLSWEERVRALTVRREIADGAGEGWAEQLARTRAKRMHALHGNGGGGGGGGGGSAGRWLRHAVVAPAVAAAVAEAGDVAVAAEVAAVAAGVDALVVAVPAVGGGGGDGGGGGVVDAAGGQCGLGPCEENRSDP